MIKAILNRPDLTSLASILELYDEIIENCAQAKIVSLIEYRKILAERDFYLKKYVKLSKKAIFG